MGTYIEIGGLKAWYDEDGDEAQEALASVEVELVAKLAACRRDLFFDPGVRVRRVKTAC